MFYKITIDSNALVIQAGPINPPTETIVDIPKRLVYYDLDKLQSNDTIQLRFIDKAHEHLSRNIPAVLLTDSLDATDTAYDATTWTDFARTNLGV